MRLEGRLVIPLHRVGELRVLIRLAVHERSLRPLDDGLDVVAGDRLVGLERVRDRQDLGAVLTEELRGDLQHRLELLLDPLPQIGLQEVPVGPVLGRRRAAPDDRELRHPVGGNGVAHGPIPEHPRRHRDRKSVV